MDDELIAQLYWDRSENAITETDRKYGAYCNSIAYGCGGKVANENWFGAEGMGNVTVDPGTYTITFDPATGAVTVE